MRTSPEKTFVRWTALAVVVIAISGCGGGEASKPPPSTAVIATPPAFPLDPILQACQKKMDAMLFGIVGDSPGPYDVSLTVRTRAVSPTDDGRSEELKGSQASQQKLSRDRLRELCQSDEVQFFTHVGEIPAPAPLGDDHHGH